MVAMVLTSGLHLKTFIGSGSSFLGFAGANTLNQLGQERNMGFRISGSGYVENHPSTTCSQILKGAGLGSSEWRSAAYP